MTRWGLIGASTIAREHSFPSCVAVSVSLANARPACIVSWREAACSMRASSSDADFPSCVMASRVQGARVRHQDLLAQRRLGRHHASRFALYSLGLTLAAGSLAACGGGDEGPDLAFGPGDALEWKLAKLRIACPPDVQRAAVGLPSHRHQVAALTSRHSKLRSSRRDIAS